MRQQDCRRELIRRRRIGCGLANPSVSKLPFVWVAAERTKQPYRHGLHDSELADIDLDTGVELTQSLRALKQERVHFLCGIQVSSWYLYGI